MSTLRCPYPASNAAPSAVGCGIESTSTAILPSQSWPWSLGSARTWWPAESRGANPQARTVARRGRRHGSFGMKRRTRHALIFLGVPTVLVLLTHRHKPGSDADRVGARNLRRVSFDFVHSIGGCFGFRLLHQVDRASSYFRSLSRCTQRIAVHQARLVRGSTDCAVVLPYSSGAQIRS
jgi:hypothetical protein